MSILEAADRRSKGVSVPRWMVLILGLFVYSIVFPLVHAGIPWALSRLMPRYGWTEQGPGTGNLLGLIPIAVGAGGFIWIFVTGLQHFDEVPKRVKLGLTPPYLLTRGPYALTRHPMYVAALALWFGWALFYGSVAGLVGSMVVLLWVNFVVPREERGLETAFGQVYLEYKNQVPRWFGKHGD